MTDTELKINGLNLLTEKFGEVLAERFVTLFQRENFDYTKWQKNLWENKTIEEISNIAMKEYKKIS